MKAGLTGKELQNRILRDLFVGVIAIVFLACAAYFLDLIETVAEWTGRSELREIDIAVVLLMFSVWLFGIFSLRRLDELKSVLTERGKMEKRVYETQKVESLARMATGVAHDFNNLLVAITGFCGLALDRPDASDQIRKDLMEIKNAGDRASSLIQRLLTFARKKPPETRVLDINEVVSNMKPLLRHLVGKNVQMEATLQPDLDRVKVNLTQIEEVLVNLVLNAHDAMPDGGQLTIEASNVNLDKPGICEKLGLKPGDYVKLSVKDTGSGINPKIRDHIFNPFFTTREKGTGLGLSMVSGIVKQNNGAIDVDSEPGRGTTFNIYLPKVAEGCQ